MVERRVERRLSPVVEPTIEEVEARAALRQKLSGDVAWVPGDTEESFEQKVSVYQLERIQDIRSGKPTWLRANFSSNFGARYDFFRDGRCVGTIVEDERDCDVFDANDGPEGPQPIVRRPGLQLAEAVEIVETHGLSN